MDPSPRRYVVVGISGSGKSTLARVLAAGFAIPHVELDGLFWGPAWTPKPLPEFRRLVAAAVASPEWVVDGNYSAARDIVWPRATAIVWLRYPLWRVFWRVFLRTLRRLRTREALWHGNRESLRRTFCSRESILWWVLTAHGRRRREFDALMRSGAFPDAAWVVLRSPPDTAAWLASRGRRCAVPLPSSGAPEGAGAPR